MIRAPGYGLGGRDGRDGVDGADGQDGRDGTNGTNGRDGTNGTNGTNGAKGDKGDRGDVGPSFIISAPTVTSLTTAQMSGTAFQPRADGQCGLNVTARIGNTSILNIMTTITVAMSAAQGGAYTTVAVMSLTLNAAGVGVGDSATGTLFVPPGWWVRVTRQDVGVLSSVSMNRVVWNL